MADQTQHRIGRVRPPRVQITYDVEIGDAVEVKELPFVVGIMADLAGNTEQKKLKERSFINIDQETFSDVMGKMGPSPELVVDNKMGEGPAKMPVNLKFDTMADFGPMALIDQVPELKAAYERRTALNALLGRIFVDEDLSEALNTIIQESANDKEIQTRLEAMLKELG